MPSQSRHKGSGNTSRPMRHMIRLLKYRPSDTLPPVELIFPKQISCAVITIGAERAGLRIGSGGGGVVLRRRSSRVCVIKSPAGHFTSISRYGDGVNVIGGKTRADSPDGCLLRYAP